MTERVALILPGGGYGVEGPVLYYPAIAARRRGADLRRHAWTRQFSSGEAPVDFAVAEIGPIVEAAIRAGERPLIIAKSLSTSAAVIAARHGLPAIWLTPVLTWPSVVDGIRANAGPSLLVGGTGDSMWDATLARELSPHVCEIPGGDHSLLVDGPLSLSLDAMSTVTAAVEAFLDEIGWAASP